MKVFLDKTNEILKIGKKIIPVDYVTEDDEYAFYIPKHLIKNRSVNDFPSNIILKLIEEEKEGFVVATPFSFLVDKEGNCEIEVNDDNTRKYWDGFFGLPAFVEAKKEAVEQREDTQLIQHQDNHDYVLFSYNIQSNFTDFGKLISHCEQVYEKIEQEAIKNLERKVLQKYGYA